MTSAGQIYRIAMIQKIAALIFGCILNLRSSGNARMAIPCVQAISFRPCVALVCFSPRIWDTPLLNQMLQDDAAYGARQAVLLASHTGAKLYPVVGYEQIGTLLLYAPEKIKC